MKWIDVNDRLPDHTNLVMVFETTFDAVWVGSYDVMWKTLEDDGTDVVSHWMELPKSPEK